MPYSTTPAAGKLPLVGDVGQPSTLPIRDPEALSAMPSGEVCFSAAVGNAQYVLGSVESYSVPMLVDTGSSISFVSTTFYERVMNQLPALSKTSSCIQSVNGNLLNIRGSLTLAIRLGNVSCQNKFIVADIVPNVLLGVDFLQQHQCSIDFANQTVKIQDVQLPLITRDAISASDGKVCNTVNVSASVRLSASVDIPGFSQVIVQGRVDGSFPDRLVCIEPCQQFLEKFNVGSARVLTGSNEAVSIRLQNWSSDPVTIRKDTIVGILEDCTVEPTSESEPESCNAVSEDPVSDPVELFDLSHLDDNQTTQVRALLSEFRDVISTGSMDLGSTSVLKHDIVTESPHPIRQAPRRLPVHQSDEVRDHVNQLLQEGLIAPSSSPWAAPIVVVRKTDGSLRLCVDYRKLNSNTVKDAFPIPRIEDAIDSMSKAKYFTTLDLASGYWQVELSNAAKAKSAFVTPFGLYQWNVMPFGLCNAPSTFQRLMNTVLGDLIPDVCTAYVDDTNTFSATLEEHLVNLRKVLQRFREAGLKIKPKKCQILKKSVTYLGHTFSADGVSPNPSKYDVITKWPIPQSAKDIKRFVGLASYYRRFIKNFASIAAPLHKLTQKGLKFVWSSQCQEAFDMLKLLLTSAPVLSFPEKSRVFILDTDASDVGIGATISQVGDDGQEHPVSFASKALSKSERKYSTTRREMLAVVVFVQYFKHYLLGAKFTLRTDHRALLWLKSFKDSEGILARWIEKLEAFNFNVIHREGRLHANADALSRLPECDCACAVTSCAVLNSADPVPSTDEPAATPPPTAPPTDLNTSVTSQPPVSMVTSAATTVEGTVVPNWSGFFSPEDIKKAQADDTDIDSMIGWQQAFIDRPKRSDQVMRGASLVLLRLWSQWKRLELHDGVLYRRFSSADGLLSHLQLVVPADLKKQVLTMVHDDSSGGHLATERTLVKAKARFYWPFMSSDIDLHCKSCDLCSARNNPAPAAKAPMQRNQSSFPMQRLAMDIMGPLPKTQRGNSYIVVITDYFTKWVEAFAIPDMTARTIASALVDGFICRYGAPVSIHTDQGTQFESKLFRNICDLLDIKKTRTTPYHPASDGLVERMNRTLEKMLSARVSANHDDWDLHLQRCLLAYRSSQHSSTKETPAMMMFGHELRLPVDIMFNDSRHDAQTVLDHLNNLQLSLQQSYSHARTAGAQAQKRQKDYYDAKSSSPRYAVGTFVRLHHPAVKPGRSKKFHLPWTGPHKVIEVLDDVVYRIEDCVSSKRRVVHVNRLKPASQSTANQPSASQPSASQWQQSSVLPSATQPVPHVDYFEDGADAAPVNPPPAQHGYQLRNRGNIQPPGRYRH